MKKYIVTALFSLALIVWAHPACAGQGRVPGMDFDGEITIGAVLGEEVLRQALPAADQLARELFTNVEGSVLVRINGTLVRVMKGNRTVIEILDDPGASWEHGEGNHREGHKHWKRHKKRHGEQARKRAERAREARKRAAEQAREARKKEDKRIKRLRKSLPRQEKETDAGRRVRL